jgi:hypothetical protein
MEKWVFTFPLTPYRSTRQALTSPARLVRGTRGEGKKEGPIVVDSFCKYWDFLFLRNQPKAKQLQFLVPNIMVNSFTRLGNISLYYGKHARWFGEFFTGFKRFSYDWFRKFFLEAYWPLNHDPPRLVKPGDKGAGQ